MSLLQRLGRTYDSATGEELARIVDNLTHILNCKRGYSSFIETLGIGDLNHLNAKEDIARAVMQDIAANIQQFEPRIEVLDVQEIKTDATARMSFRLDCRLRADRRALRIILDPVAKALEVQSP